MLELARCILRLAPTLRCQVFTYASKANGSNWTLSGTATRNFAQIARRNASPPKPKVHRHPASKSNAGLSPPPVQARRQPSGPSQSLPPSYIGGLLRGADEIMLYRAPNQRSFTWLSYLVGGVFTLGAFNFAYLNNRASREAGTERQRPWSVKASEIGTALVLAIFGAAVISAPNKMVKSIALVRSGVERGTVMAVLRFVMKRPVPMIPYGGGSFDTPMSSVFLDRNVAAQEMNFTSMSPSQTRSAKESAEIQADSQTGGILSRVKGINNSMLDLWPILKRDTRKILLREGMAYVHITEHGKWKIDLQGCELLDGGRPLERLTTPDSTMHTGFVGKLQTLIGS